MPSLLGTTGTAAANLSRMPDPQAVASVEAALLAPGAPFETEEALVLGERMAVFKNRPRSLRELVARSQALGAAEAMLFTDGALERRWSFEEQAGKRLERVREAVRRLAAGSAEGRR